MSVRRIAIGIVMAAAGVSGFLPTGTAAATTGGATQSTIVYDCVYQADFGIDLFTSPTSHTANYFVGKGTRMSANGCVIQAGRSYTDCGGGTDWVKVAVGVKHGWAATSCVTRLSRIPEG